eukprot:XP_008767142.1 PREDICTED: zinc finger protein 100-like isoform X1 [Rattus norvegicus]
MSAVSFLYRLGKSPWAPVLVHLQPDPSCQKYPENSFLTLSCDWSQTRPLKRGRPAEKCGACYKAFSRSSLLRTHPRAHTGKRPYACAECRKACNQSAHLTHHLRIRTGERPYKCGGGKAFSCHSSLTVHEKRSTTATNPSAGTAARPSTAARASPSTRGRTRATNPSSARALQGRQGLQLPLVPQGAPACPHR